MLYNENVIKWEINVLLYWKIMIMWINICWGMIGINKTDGEEENFSTSQVSIPLS